MKAQDQPIDRHFPEIVLIGRPDGFKIIERRFIRTYRIRILVKVRADLASLDILNSAHQLRRTLGARDNRRHATGVDAGHVAIVSDRKSTSELQSPYVISYAVFCLK